MYYLQSRYYDPEICRFINADEFASTGQGILGNNMFAYCNNNPVVYSDALGTAPNIIDYYIIHRMVQKSVAAKRGFALEVRVDCDGRTGRLDLYDPRNNLFYEVKSSGQAKRWPTSQQRAKYITSYINDIRFRGDFSTPPSPGSIFIEGSFDYKDYHITYEAVGTELIVYTVEPYRSSQPSTVKVAEKENASVPATSGIAIYGLPVVAPSGGIYFGSGNPLREVIK